MSEKMILCYLYYKIINFLSQKPYIRWSHWLVTNGLSIQAKPSQIPQLIQFSIKFCIILEAQRIHLVYILLMSPQPLHSPQRVTQPSSPLIQSLCIYKVYFNDVSTQSPQVVRICCGDGWIIWSEYVSWTACMWRNVHWMGCVEHYAILCVCLYHKIRQTRPKLWYLRKCAVYKGRTHRALSTQSICFYGIRSVCSITKYVICIKFIRLKARLVSFGVYMFVVRCATYTYITFRLSIKYMYTYVL